ncbi:MAG: phosphoribosyltransferase [Firmicutes bacterium]|jgi:predicted phosphoribosyltransferase|nr:phosphoribosyltransferase [Bacillota bacterium]
MSCRTYSANLLGGIGDMMFRDRHEAGRVLGERLAEYKGKGAVVLALPRGGVPVAEQVAIALDASLDVVVARKIGAPFNEEVAVGAVGPDGEVVLNERLVKAVRIPQSYIDSEVRAEIAEIARRTRDYRGDAPPAALEGKTVILVDDGIATGYTAIAAARHIRRQNPAWLVIATPVAPPDTLEALAREADDVVCVWSPEDFAAVGQAYWNFSQTMDREVLAILDRWLARSAGQGTGKEPQNPS